MADESAFGPSAPPTGEAALPHPAHGPTPA
jgi:hypothetical protein